MRKLNYITFLNKRLYLNKNINLSLNLYYGIGKVLSKKICQSLGINLNLKSNLLNTNDFLNLENFINKNFKLIEKPLKTLIYDNINNKKKLKIYKGLRHRLNLPVNGQKTRTNAQTQKNKNIKRYRKAFRKKKNKLKFIKR